MEGLDEISTVTLDPHNYLHSYLIYFLTDVKHNHKKSDNFTKSTQ